MMASIGESTNNASETRRLFWPFTEVSIGTPPTTIT